MASSANIPMNFRSTTNIVKAAQKVINDKSTSGSNAAIRQDMKPMRGKGPSPRVLACADAKAEGKWNRGKGRIIIDVSCFRTFLTLT